MSTPLSTVFFGSGPVAARSLELLLAHTPIEYVITKPRPAHHRGAVPVLEVAAAHGLPILTAANRQELDQLMAEHKFSSDHAILIDFGIIVSQRVIDSFPKGIINSHFSLLPKLRGADPITWSIANGDSETGVSLMLIDTGMDTGQLIAQQALALDGNETSASLTASLIKLSDALLQKHLADYLAGNTLPYDQPDAANASYSRKLTKQDGVIDWQDQAKNIASKIRAFSDWPKSHTSIGTLPVIITSAQAADTAATTPGAVTIENNRLFISANDVQLEILELKPAGKKSMPAQAFLAGYRNQLSI